MSILAAYFVPHPPLIVPAVGQGREREIQATIDGYRHIAEEIATLQPETIVIFSPHAAAHRDYIHISPGEGAQGDFSRFAAADSFDVRYDSELVQTIATLSDQAALPAGTLGERESALDHGTLVPLHFLKQAQVPAFRIVRVGISNLTREQHYRFGMLVQEAVQRLGRRTVLIASGDLSHKLKDDGPYGFAPEGPALDQALTGVLRNGNFDQLFWLPQSLCEAGAECGLRPLLMLAGAVDGLAITPTLLSYEGPFGVGYATATFAIGDADDSRRFLHKRGENLAAHTAQRRQNEDIYVHLARQTLEAYIHGGELPPCPEDLPEELTQERAGVFVTIKKHGELRGCIGTIAPTKKSIASEIRHNAIAAATQDPRFEEVTEEELPALVYSVDILSAPEPADASMLDPERYGVIVTSGHKRGLLLPNLDGVNTAQQQVQIARQKARIRDGEPITLERFEVVRHK